MTLMNLNEQTLPQFSRIEIERILPAIADQINANRGFLETLLRQTQTPNWQNFIEPMSIQENQLDNLWSPISHLNAVKNADPLRKQYEACLPLLTEYAAEVGQNQALYQAYQKLADQKGLSKRQQKIVADSLRDFKLSGVQLPQEQQSRYREIKKQLSQLGSQFSNHVLDNTNSWSYLVSEKSQLAGVPDSTMEALANKAQDKGQQGYLLDLQFPTYLAIMTYAEDRALRERVYRAYTSRASDLSEQKDWDNGPLIDEILSLRHELAQLLGFETYADYSVATKMAKDPQQVLDFLMALAKPSYQSAKEEFAALLSFAKEQDNINDLAAWDVTYYSEKLREKSFNISQEALRPYFPEAQVLETLFGITQQLFSVTIKPREAVDVWHDSVRFYDIYSSEGEIIASFYMDLYARENKRGGAWMGSCRDRLMMSDHHQRPVAYLTCNFASPTAAHSALLTHDEVLTLFHEFGHGLHHMLTDVDEVQVSGINGVEWDAVELPSQLLENYAFHKPTLKQMAKHFQTGEALDETSIDQLIAARTFQAGMMMVRQLEFALFDFRIHYEYQPQQKQSWQTILAEVREQLCVVPVPEFNRFAQSFSHIFAGGYAAGYYSYKWAEVLSADVWEYFVQNGPLSAETGQHYWQHILSQGGSKPAMELFVDFRGREPAVEPLLKQQGIAA